MDNTSGHVEALSREECLRLLEVSSVGRVALTAGALPLVLPVSFQLDEESIVFAVGGGAGLDAATDGAVVALEADNIDPETGRGWTVLVTGIARKVGDSGDAASTVSRSPLWQWPPLAPRRLVRLSLDLVAGQRMGDDAHGPAVNGAATNGARR